MPSAGHSSMPTACTASYSAASSPGSPQAAIQLADSRMSRSRCDVRGEDVGDGLGHGHARGGGGIEQRQRRALAHRHGLAGVAEVVAQRHGDIGHRHLPGPDHLVAADLAAHGAIADA